MAEPTTMKTEAPKEIKLTMEQYEHLMGRIDKMEGSNSAPLSKRDRETKHIATLMLFDGKPVIKFDDVKSEEKIDKNGELFMVTSSKINIHVKDGDKVEKREVNYKSLMENATRVSVELEKMDKKEVEIPQGVGVKKIWTSPADPVGLRESNKQFRTEQVELTQTIVKTLATVKIVEGEMAGQTLVIDADSLNR